ncbi:sigma factor [Streptomyces sp. KR55]|uniref:sigma factor n=1 Tax=Streptomyces sp. KR55 TaxID=3457425 RepID=UPI003FCF4DB2
MSARPGQAHPRRPTAAGTACTVPRFFSPAAATRSDTSSSLCRRWGRSDPTLHQTSSPGPLRRSRARCHALDWTKRAETARRRQSACLGVERGSDCENDATGTGHQQPAGEPRSAPYEIRGEAPSSPHLYGAAWRMTHHAADAEELVQEAYTRVRLLDQFRPGTNFAA